MSSQLLDTPASATEASARTPSASLRIVHVVRQFSPSIGGLEAVVESLAREQVRAGHSVRVLTLDRVFHGDGSRLPHRAELDGIEIRRVPYFGSKRYPIAPGVLRHLKDADVVHVHAIDFLFDYLAITKPIHRKKLVVSTHGGFFHTEFAKTLKTIFFHTVTRASLSRYGYVAASSVQDEQTFRRLRSRGVGLVENGVDIEKFHDCAARLPRKTILTFGRLAPNKNIGALFSFLRVLRERDGDWRLIVAGRPSGVDLEELEAAAAAAGVAEFVTLVESPSDDQLRQLISQSSVFASASKYEGFGIAPIEAASAGLLPVISDIPPHRRTLEGLGIGTLVDFSEPTGAAEAFLASWQDWSGDQGRSRTRAMTSVERYAWGGVASRFEEIYRNVRGEGSRLILGAKVRVTDAARLVEQIDDVIEKRAPVHLAFLNANLANLVSGDRELAEALQSFVVVNDGIGVDIGSALLYGRRFPENLNGTDFTPFFLGATRHRLKLFLLGGRPEVVLRAADIMSDRWPRHTVVGTRDGFFPTSEEGEVARTVQAAAPDLVLVAMGNRRQELWIARHLEETGPSALAIGALFDFLTGEVRRAPAWVRHIRCEWVFRLALEPRRLAKRYLIGNVVFLARVLGQLVRGERAQ